MKVRNMISSRGGKSISNQFIVSDDSGNCYFQSYGSVIVKRPIYDNESHPKIQLDEKYWNYSRTTAKYRAVFLGETTKETQKKIDSGEYELVDLN